MSTHSANTAGTQICPSLNFNFDNDTEGAKKGLAGILAPETTQIPPVAAAREDSKQSKPPVSQSSVTSREVLDHMVRLDYSVDAAKGGTLISFHMDYQDYLASGDYIDPEEAKKLTKPEKT